VGFGVFELHDWGTAVRSATSEDVMLAALPMTLSLHQPASVFTRAHAGHETRV
jgi:hypothetical protein